MIIQENSDIEDLSSTLGNLPDILMSSLSGAALDAGGLLQDTVNESLSGPVLQSKSGRLRDSFILAQEEQGGTVNTELTLSEDVPYAAIQEYGGQTKAHVIMASQAKVLSFPFAGKQGFYTQVFHPGSAIPEHGYLRNSLESCKDEITSRLTDSVLEPLGSV